MLSPRFSRALERAALTFAAVAAVLLLSLLAAATASAQAPTSSTFADSLRAQLAPLFKVKPDTVAIVHTDTLTRVDTLRSVHVDTVWATLVHVDTLRITDTVRVASSPPPTPAPAPAPPPPVVTPPPPVPSSAADTLRAKFVATFTHWNPLRRTADGLGLPAGSSYADYYDRAHAEYQACKLPELAQDSTYLCAYGDTLAVTYRDSYLIASANFNPSPHWSQLEGVAEHYRRTGDTVSLHAVLATADHLWGMTGLGGRYVTRVNGETRILGRVQLAQLLAWELARTHADSVRYGMRIDSLTTLAQSWQLADGSYPADGQVCGGQLNYMSGLLATVQVQVFERYKPDARIPGLVQRALDYVLNTQRNGATINYASVTCAGIGAPTPAADLDEFFVTALGWLWQRSGDAAYHDAAEQLFADGVAHGSPQYAKQFNEMTQAFRYLGYR